MRNTKRKWALLVLAVFGGTLILSGCSNTKTYASDCALIVGRGVGDTRSVKDVIHPGEQSHLKGDDEQFVVPCNARNFLVTPGNEHGDRHNPMTGTTKKVLDANGTPLSPGTPVQAFARMYWTLNQDDNVLSDRFFPVCRKYACASRTTNGGEDTSNFSTPGWNGMLEENHSLIIDSAFQQAITQFDPNVWNEQEEWPKVAEAMAPIFMEQMRSAVGSQNVDLFCGTWTPANPNDPGKGTGKCDPVRFTITSIQPQDPGVVQSYNATIKAQQDSQNKIADLKRQQSQVQAEQDLADARQKLLEIPGYRLQLEHQYRMEEIQACGAAQLSICPGSSSAGVLVSPK